MVKLFVEGGGGGLEKECREGFRKFITTAGIKNQPRIVASGSRSKAFDDYRIAIDNGEEALLLIDSEAPVADQHQQGADADQWKPWAYLRNRQDDAWEQPAGASDTDCHLMVQCMENWFLADSTTLRKFFGQGFKENKLPAHRPIEQVAKNEVHSALADATQGCKTKAPYGKSEHSFKLLAEVDPGRITAASPWAKRFVDALKKKMHS
ncbi:DUF4276 family protein [Verminephrobacter aporrectodeae]|uniref:DUF4276 family protein n=1 Tax=Verminephrobacter aporrectodeae TaxID=1110389 RepID=UPI002244D968|nr:DUF4276 family protein [Verminephrobacter aporrectodeae]MCW8166057.1 DUF4276 family protein [Verminephrobacter aporrectodeae subsp. tuberculatae]MCW8170066.1 DUF4276 family protein [Verminephrobacter aporrectodeae subsp. tuberculatae]MCW8174228.1 DUF4276 family protein [Verminephrobacter aporrectodeae subsp. tuberculatae]MCW8201928.1 DUF4276 family protein [Verminephrobacter aporrectodeae subsp. tuberculatae]